MAFDPWQAALLGPAAVAVHDDRHVCREDGERFIAELCCGAGHALGQAAIKG